MFTTLYLIEAGNSRSFGIGPYPSDIAPGIAAAHPSESESPSSKEMMKLCELGLCGNTNGRSTKAKPRFLGSIIGAITSLFSG